MLPVLVLDVVHTLPWCDCPSCNGCSCSLSFRRSFLGFQDAYSYRPELVDSFPVVPATLRFEPVLVFRSANRFSNSISCALIESMVPSSGWLLMISTIVSNVSVRFTRRCVDKASSEITCGVPASSLLINVEMNSETEVPGQLEAFTRCDSTGFGHRRVVSLVEGFPDLSWMLIGSLSMSVWIVGPTDEYSIAVARPSRFLQLSRA